MASSGKPGNGSAELIHFRSKNLISTHMNKNQYEDSVLRVQNLCKSYEEGKPVLKNLCLNVKRGTIYGLLGSSGCGKTSLLSCAVGLTKWDSGDIFLFKKKPQGYPGKRVGFMPQDVALYDQLSIREMMGYYGLLYGMKAEKVEKQWLWLSDFLQLPTEFKIIKDLSGGQKRRASLSLCLLHRPELLILDEPTVGLDPVLRESIWQHLIKMVRTDKTTVIITTHYIEETKLSDTIGVMRNGRLLVENSPQSLLADYQCERLEQLVLKLCHADESKLLRKKQNNLYEVTVDKCEKKRPFRTNLSTAMASSSKKSYNVSEKFQETWGLSSQRMSSLRFGPTVRRRDPPSTLFDRVWGFCNVIRLVFWRNPVFMVMVLFLPALQTLLTLASFAAEPKDLRFGIVDLDSPNYDFCFKVKDNSVTTITSFDNISLIDPGAGSCSFQNLTCAFLKELAVSGTILPEPIPSKELAQKYVDSGRIWGYFYFQPNFTDHMRDFILYQRHSEIETLEGREIPLVMDMSSYIASTFAIRDSFQAYQRFLENIANNCGADPREVQLPLSYGKPVYGNEDSIVQDYIVPVVIIMVLFEVPMFLIPIIFINDRKQGTFDRARVAGLQFKEVMLAHLITQGSVIIGQTAICFVVMSFTYGFGVTGSVFLYFIFCVMGGICGESFGLLLGVICSSEVEALMAGIFVGPILLVMAGSVWPLELMRPIVRIIASSAPTTLIMTTIRAVVYKGVGILHQEVWPGIAIILGWTFVFWILSILCFVKKQK